MTSLSEGEIETLEGVLRTPILFPDEFKTWLTDWITINLPYIPISQVMGYKGTLANSSVVNTADTANSSWAPERAWVGLQTPGPQITGLADGEYFVSFGGHMRLPVNDPAGAAEIRIGLSINGDDPSDYVWRGGGPERGYSGWRALPVDVKSGTDNNTLSLKYYYDLSPGQSAIFEYRWLTALRIT